MGIVDKAKNAAQDVAGTAKDHTQAEGKK
ncbi:MAG: hypothetical protein QOJ61_3589, partial [Mycobacterium sp.]|nr:hypothetical protein [Mycobacterium sp.]